jgi:hypothetical protein
LPALLAALWLLGSATPAAAQEDKGSFGIGLILGEPTGGAAKLYLSRDTAIAAAVGSAVIGGGLHVHADFLLHPWILESRDSFVMPIYLGGGVRVVDRDTGDGDGTFHVGLRIVGGLLFDFTEIPLDVFAEIAAVPDYEFADNDSVGIEINAGLGVRYYL